MQGWLEVEQLEATENYQEGPLIKPTELKTLAIIHPTCSKGSIYNYWDVLNFWFLGICTFSERLMQPEGCCSVDEATAEGTESTGKEEWVQKINFPHITLSIFGSHVNREDNK